MIPISDNAWTMYGGVATNHTLRVESWRGGDLLSANIPAVSAEYTADNSLQVPESVTLTVPVEVNGVRYDPLDEDDPLAPYGQRLRIAVGIRVQGGQYEFIPRGDFLITNVTRDQDVVQVQAASMLQLIEEARLITPLQPASGDTLKTLARRLVEPAIPVVIDSDLVDRAVSDTFALQWDEDRLAALYELADAWPARVKMHSDGYLLFDPVPVFDEDDWVVSSTGSIARQVATSTRESGRNCVVARGTDSTGLQVQGVAYDTAADSPTKYGGPFNPLPVPEFFQSPLLTTNLQCLAAATTIMARRRKVVARQLTLDMSEFHPIELDDIVRIYDDRVGIVSMTVESISLPLIPNGNPMTLGLAVPVDG